MKKQKLNYRFHNPNAVEATAEQLLKLFVKVNEGKVEEEIRGKISTGDKEENHKLYSV